MRQRQVVVYLSNAVDESIKAERSITTDSPAATNKVFALAAAMRGVDIHCIVLSLGRGRQNSTGIKLSATTLRVDQGAVIYADFWHFPLLTHLVSFISLAFLLVKLIRLHPGLCVLAYNRSYHYLLALFIARLLGVNLYLDLEDGYNVENKGILRHVKNYLTRLVFNSLCSSGAVIATSGLAKQLSHSAPLVCYGVADYLGQPLQNWQAPKLQILFSGSLIEEAGSGLLLDTLKILRQRYTCLQEVLHFVVTGKGPWASTFQAFALEFPEWLTFGEGLLKAKYLDQLSNCHVGLSLRLASFEMSDTTFPSKVIEYANHGLLVLTTRASDVPILLDEGACYLDEETPYALAELLASLPVHRIELAKTAKLGQRRVQEMCNPKVVGKALKQLLSNRISN
jgi:hypothetical protein